MRRRLRMRSHRSNRPRPGPERQAGTDRITVVVDTREQEPYPFDSEGVTTTRRALPAGDYSLDGWEHQVAVERKTLEDLVATVIRSRKRFHKELECLAEYSFACIVVEANLGDILTEQYRSGAHPNAVLGSVLSIVVDFRIPVFFCSDRQGARAFVEGYLRGVHRIASTQWEPQL